MTLKLLLVQVVVWGVNPYTRRYIILRRCMGKTWCLRRVGSSLVGTDAGELAGIGRISIKVTDNLTQEKGNFDILIDFTLTGRYHSSI